MEAQIVARRRETRNLQKLDPGHTLSRDEILQVADKVVQFCQISTGMTFHPYQAPFALRLIQSLLLEDGEEITALWSRQSGKTETIATTVVGCMVILPRLAQVPALAADSRIAKFKDGLWVGIFAPVYDQGGIMHSRMAVRMASESMREVCADPEIDIPLNGGRQVLSLPTGSYVDCASAAPGTHIEGRTYHLVICEESQDITDYKMKKSIHPMCAATGGTLVKIGTPNIYKRNFYKTCERNKRRDLAQHGKAGYLPCNYHFDYTHAARANIRYARYVEKEIERLGYDSDEFKMAYRLIWILDRGHFLSSEAVEERGVQARDVLKIKKRGLTSKFVRPDYPTTHDQTTENQVASIDIGKTNDSTVITIGRIWWDNPIMVSGETRYYIHVSNWLEIEGDDHEAQYPKILDFLKNYNIGTLVVDATGRGDPFFLQSNGADQ